MLTVRNFRTQPTLLMKPSKEPRNRPRTHVSLQEVKSVTKPGWMNSSFFFGERQTENTHTTEELHLWGILLLSLWCLSGLTQCLTEIHFKSRYFPPNTYPSVVQGEITHWFTDKNTDTSQTQGWSFLQFWSNFEANLFFFFFRFNCHVCSRQQHTGMTTGKNGPKNKVWHIRFPDTMLWSHYLQNVFLSSSGVCRGWTRQQD